MRLVTYSGNGAPPRAGVLVGERVVDAAGAARRAGLAHGGDGTAWTAVRRILGAGREDLRALQAAAEEALDGGGAETVSEPAGAVRLGPPVPDPEKIICLGLNYGAHAAEASLEAPGAPMLFAKFRNSLVGQGSPIVLPRASEQVDYEGELAVVIGRRCKEVPEEEALGYVAGYMALNDVSARDLQLKTSQWTGGKALDTFAPCGPALVTADEVADVQNLLLETRLNGETVQSAKTSMMIFPVGRTIEFISSLMTLEPGDVIATGTPSGVGFKRNPPLFLREGDEVEVEIEAVGTLKNPVVGPDGGG